MPYVTDEAKSRLNIGGGQPDTVGEVNYLATCVAITYLTRILNREGKLTYADISGAISALEEAANEMRRRLLIPYEDDCIRRNGDIYPRALLAAAKVPGLEPAPRKRTASELLFPLQFHTAKCVEPNCPICNP